MKKPKRKVFVDSELTASYWMWKVYGWDNQSAAQAGDKVIKLAELIKKERTENGFDIHAD